MDKIKKIGIMGGTFDPIHIGHLIMAQSALSELQLDQIVFMPSGNPPHKSSNLISDAGVRLDMVKVAIDNNEKFVYSDFELKREGIIYTSDTLELIKKQYDHIEIYFIVGADSLLDIEKWHEPDKIFRLCKMVVVDRDNSNEKIIAMKEYLSLKYHAEIFYINSPLVCISSTYIRNCVAKNQSVKYLIPESVEEYISTHHLYQT
ncbi:MAG: nicotinate-nucleotide adenylyltransferase [Lachnospiraceae bacterium]|nr:nicotinate-nucleotide adenylyltransferase [Lachnospiraceae bacterium]